MLELLGSSFDDKPASRLLHGIAIVLSMAGPTILAAFFAHHGNGRVMAASAAYATAPILLL